MIWGTDDRQPLRFASHWEQLREIVMSAGLVVPLRDDGKLLVFSLEGELLQRVGGDWAAPQRLIHTGGRLYLLEQGPDELDEWDPEVPEPRPSPVLALALWWPAQVVTRCKCGRMRPTEHTRWGRPRGGSTGCACLAASWLCVMRGGSQSKELIALSGL